MIGGDSRGLSSLVRDTVSYVDPAFPNLEFHRRAAMDKAGYFMPGYKPQVFIVNDDTNDVLKLRKSTMFFSVIGLLELATNRRCGCEVSIKEFGDRKTTKGA